MEVEAGESSFLLGELIDYIATLLDPPSLCSFKLVSKRCREAYQKCLGTRMNAFVAGMLSKELQWKHLPRSNSPHFRITAGHTAHPLVPMGIIVFGGEEPAARVFYNDAHVFDAATNTWTPIETGDGPLPPTRGFPSVHSVLLQNEWHLLIFGGQIRTDKSDIDWDFYNDIWVMNLEQTQTVEVLNEKTKLKETKEIYRWRELKPVGDKIIEARVGHRSCILDGKLWVFGGCFTKDDVYSHFNDMWCFDLQTCSWTKLDVPEPLPAPRHSPALSVLDEHSFSICGGAEVRKDDFDDVWVFNTKSMKWTPKNVKITDATDWFSMNSFALSPTKIVIFTLEPVVIDLEANTVMELPKVMMFWARVRLLLKGYDFCLCWSKHSTIVLKCNTVPWPLLDTPQEPKEAKVTLLRPGEVLFENLM